MARYLVNQFSNFPYHITGRVSNREAFRLPLAQVWELFSEHLWIARHVDSLKIHAFVLMPNHFHLIASIENGPICVPMTRFLRETSRSLNYYGNHMNQNWGTRHYKCEIRGYINYLNVYKYVYQNPLRAHLADSVTDWPWSTLHGLMGKSKLLIPVQEDPILFVDNRSDDSCIKWLNQKIDSENLVDVRSALSRKAYKLPAARNRKQHPLSEHLI